MSDQPLPPLMSRLVDVGAIPAGGLHMRVDATPAEREQIARAFGLDGIDRLEGAFTLSGRGRTVKVRGEVSADVRQVCVVTLEPFPAAVREQVDLEFAEEAPEPRAQEGGEEHSSEMIDAPDPIVNGKIDLGVLTAEFLALGLDPYPRKPGVESFEHTEDAGDADSPFASLRRLRSEPEG